jgi:RIO kinase 1
MPRKSTKEKFKVFENVFDEFTNRNLFKLISRGYFEGLQSPVKVGKEANVFSAINKNSENVIVKIYRLETCNFNRMYDYIKSDPRFPKLKRGKRKVIFAWTQREYRNLLKARQGNVSVPTPYALLFNIIVMEYIGGKEVAPLLKDKIPHNIKQFFEKIVDNMKKLYKAGLVHADISHFNILNFNERPVFIDFSQCTSIENPDAEQLLERDVRNVCNFFRKLGLEVEEKDVLKKIKT